MIGSMVACRFHRAQDDARFPDFMETAGCGHSIVLIQVCHIFRHLKNAHPFRVIRLPAGIPASVCAAADLTVAVQAFLCDADPAAMVEIASHKHGVLTGRIVRVEPDVVFPDELQIEELVPDIAVEAVIPHQQLHRLPAVHNCSFQCLYLRRVLHADRLKAAGCQLTVSGLIGGHSGQEIDKGRANANLLLGRVLNAVQSKLSFRLVSAAGGLKDNAIPNAAEAVLALREEDLSAAREIAAACEADFRKEYAAADPGVTVALEPAPACDQALTEEATLRVVRFLLLVPNGIAAMSMDIPGLVQTSCNLGIFHVTDSVLTAVSSVRSSVSSQKQMLLARIDALSQLLGGSLHVTGAYPAWEYRRESPLRDKLAAVYTQQTGKTPKIEAIHAGLECGLFAGQLPGLDCVSFGPDLVDIHTTREKMSISSVQRTWRFLLGALEALKD